MNTIATKCIVVLALAMLMNTAAMATTHTVTQSGFNFSPADIIISVGDTVQWQWTGGSHTVTSGTGLADPDIGMLFDTPLSSANPLVTHVFTEVGVVPYFCRPHVSFGMTGTVTVEAVSAVEDLPAGPAPVLLQNVPNPFNPQTLIAFHLPAAAVVELTVHDLAGRRVRTLLDRRSLSAGSHDAVWNGRDEGDRPVPAGAYFYTLKTSSTRATRSMILVK